MSVYLALGTNLGEKEKNIKNAISSLNTNLIIVKKVSKIEETVPVDFINQPNFLNCVVEVQTSLGPEKLLLCVKKIEKEMGRVKTIDKGPRIIDIDILLYDNLIYKSNALEIPHKEICNRNFVFRYNPSNLLSILTPQISQQYSLYLS